MAGARFHSNSWSSSSNSYTSTSRDIDTFVYAHDDFLVFNSAGNRGHTGGTSGTYYTTSTPSTAKNNMCIGAGRNSAGAFTQVAYFSSHGPTAYDMRFKPDLVLPPASRAPRTVPSQALVFLKGLGFRV